MPLGAHMSISGGVGNALLRGNEVGCELIQIFTKSSSQWKARPLTSEEIRIFQINKEKTGIWPVIAHNAYLINVASPDDDLHRKSLKAMLVELERGEALGIPYIVMHPGAHTGAGERAGLRRIAGSLNFLLEETRDFKIGIALETTAGQGTVLGYRFEHMAEIIEMINVRERIGVCFDTCHCFVAGYNIRDSYDEVFDEFDRIIGLKWLKAFHLNDTQKRLGSRVDRHWHIGKGEIGVEAFGRIMRDDRFNSLPLIIETPKGTDENGVDFDIINLNLLKELRRK